MEKRELKKTGEQVSLLGLGCMRFPLLGEGTQDIDTVQVQEMVDYALAHGVNYFDTAYGYHEGKSESVIGQALKKHPRGSFNLASKMPPWYAKSEEKVEEIFQEQLDRCKVDYFDYYLIHSVDSSTIPTIEANRFYEHLKEKQKEGKIRHLGFSFHGNPATLEEYTAKYQWNFAQIQLNYMDWEQQDAKAQYEILTRKGIPVIVMEPVRGGTLVSLCDDSVEILKGANPGASTASWAIRYAASLPNVLTVLSGMSNLDQLRDNIHTLSDFKALSPGEYGVIDQALSACRLSSAIPCTACRYCMDCPEGVDIPKVFAIYNQYQTRKSKFHYLMENKVLGEDKQAERCISCGKCTGFCPQGIQIPELMHTISALTQELKAEADN